MDLLFPIHCLGCGREGDVICSVCADSLRRLEDPFCDTCAQPGVQGTCQWCYENPSKIDGIKAPYLFEGPIREAVHRLKYRGWRVAAPVLGGLLAAYLEQSHKQHQPSGEIIVPVPLHSRRLRNRGYNQSNLLAKEIGKRLGLPVQEDLLVRPEDSPPQVETRSQDDRRSNVANSFHAPIQIPGKTVLVVDDVSTTGSTLFACAAALKEAGASSVLGVVLARES